MLRQLYYDTALSYSPAALPSLLEVADPRHITYSSGFPLAPPPADRGNGENVLPRLKGLSRKADG